MLLSALLLFLVQPMFAKRVLPLLGGSPGVWNTAMVFFQGTLLLGYLYVYFMDRFLPPKAQIPIHGVVLLAAFTALPIGVAAGWSPPTGSMPAWWLLGLFGASIGLPFFALSATAPLLQRWFSLTDHPAASDPYFLYAASNVGSIAALLAYPTLVEPRIGLNEQSVLWTWAYGAFVLFMVLSAAQLVLRSTRGVMASPNLDAGRSPGARTILLWIALALLPSSLLLGVTNHLSTDVAAVPLLWVVPLAIYLLTFVLAFAARPPIAHSTVLRLVPMAVVFLLVTVAFFDRLLLFAIPAHLVTFFLLALACHGELARRRPATDHLTAYYLWIAFGGVLGGAFNALVAPVVFDSVLEYPLAIVLACGLLQVTPAAGRATWRDVLIPMAFGALLVAAVSVGRAVTDGMSFWLALVIVVGGALVVFSFKGHPVRFALGLGLLMLISEPITRPAATLLMQERDFFGVVKVQRDVSDTYRVLLHGTTIHGGQLIDPAEWTRPVTYYGAGSPIAVAFEKLIPDDEPLSVGLVGLGAGATLCLGNEHQDWTLFELDPVVVDVARDERYFHYLSECPPRWEVVQGDARLSLAEVRDDAFDVLVIDVFSSDAIPVHLITREAVELYLRKTGPDGLLLLHITNRHMDLEPVIARTFEELGLTARQMFGPEELESSFQFRSRWVVFAENPARLAAIASDDRWRGLESRPGIDAWTDDYSNILSVLKWSVQ
jgi:hypothetical protein